MGNDIKRMNYFDGLFLTAEEFNLEQDYYRKMRYRHNRYLHTPGIVQGLKVTKSGDKKVTVSAGIALNQVHEDGEDISKEIILGEEQEVDFAKTVPPYQPRDTIYIYLYLQEKKEGIVPTKGGESEIHWMEQAVVGHSKNPVNKNIENIILAKVVLDASGNVNVTQISQDDCIYAGISGNVVEAKKFTVKTDDPTIKFSLEGSQQGMQVYSSITNFDGDITLKGKLDGRDVSADGIKLDTYVSKIDTHLLLSSPSVHTASQVGALSVNGGNINGNLTLNGTLTISGTVDGRDVSVDGTKLDTYVSKIDTHLSLGSSNVHTPSQVGALSVNGGTINGNLALSGTLSVSGITNLSGDLRLNDQNIWLRTGTDQNHGIKFGYNSPFFANTPVDGPVIFGYLEGMLGTTVSGQTKVLVWNNSRVDIFGDLTVSGNIRIGATSVPIGEENLRILRGTVIVVSGIIDKPNSIFKGCTVGKMKTGIFDITFTNPFPSIPTVMVTQIFTNDGWGGSTFDNAVVVSVSANNARIKVGGGDGNPADRNFGFIVIGPRA